MRVIAVLITMLLGFTSLSANDADNDTITVLCIKGSPGEWVSQGITKAYLGKENGSSFIVHGSGNRIDVNVICHEREDDGWEIRFNAPENLHLQPGVYKNAERFGDVDVPVLDIYSTGRGCGHSCGEFEILELEYDADGKIKAFAANFVQNCEKKLPAFAGSIRFNSTIPLEERFKEILDFKPAFCLKKYDNNTGDKTELVHIVDRYSDISLQQPPYEEEGIKVCINDPDQGFWTFEFTPSLDENFDVGSYENAVMYPFKSSSTPGIEIETPEGVFKHTNGEFKVLEIRRDFQRRITLLYLDFKVESDKGEILEGVLRFGPNRVINLE